jgi:Co/Zn/Cd efflux system component
MACGTCCASSNTGTTSDPRWRKALWVVLGINAPMFAAEIVAGIAGGSHALQADALDFFSDSANYAISLGVAGMAIAWRSRAALLKGATLATLGLYVLGAALSAAWRGSAPIAPVMGLVGTVALLANGAVAVMLYRFRTGDAKHALGLDLLSQRRHRQGRGDPRRIGRLRHWQRLAGQSRRSGHGGPRNMGRVSDHQTGIG